MSLVELNILLICKFTLPYTTKIKAYRVLWWLYRGGKGVGLILIFDIGQQRQIKLPQMKLAQIAQLVNGRIFTAMDQGTNLICGPLLHIIPPSLILSLYKLFYLIKGRK